MEFEIRSIPEGYSERSDLIRFSEDFESWLDAGSGIACNAEIDRKGSRLYVKVHFAGDIICECARCCKSFAYHVQGDTSVLIEQGNEPGRDEEDGSVVFFQAETDTIVLDKIIYDEIAVRLPMKPLCASDCPGIPRKTGDAAGSIDPRWEALKQLKKDDNKSGNH